MLRTLLTLLITVFYISAYADQPNPEPGTPPKPPQEAMDACKSKGQGDKCTFTGPRGMSHEGKCHQLPRNGNMICIPKPPKIAIDACSGKKEGDSCSFRGPNNDSISGVCLTPPHDKKELACRPSRPMGKENQKQAK